MINFGNKTMNKMGGSQMISLPAAWLNGFEKPILSINIQQTDDNNLIIKPNFKEND